MTDTKVFFGMALELNGKEISLSPKTAIDEIKYKGIEMGLPPDQIIDFGRVADNLAKILSSLDIPFDTFLTADADGTNAKLKEGVVPDIDVLENAVNLLLDAELAIQEFYVKVPPTHKKTGSPADPTITALTQEEKDALGPTKYTIGLSATWGPDAGELVAGLKLKGLYFKASNEES